MLMPRTPALQDEKAPYQSMVLRRIRSSALFLGSLCLSGCLLCDKGRPGREDLSIYRATNDQAAHDCVKTEQFIVPVGSVIVIQGLDFKPGVTRLSRFQERIATQIFNCIEEITENTLGDTNAARVTGFKKMEFEILGFPDGTGGSDSSALIAQARADSVLEMLTALGTPSWRLSSRGMKSIGTRMNRGRNGTVVFVRTR